MFNWKIILGKISKSKGKIKWSSPIASDGSFQDVPSHDLDLSSIIIKVLLLVCLFKLLCVNFYVNFVVQAHKTIKNKLNAKHLLTKFMHLNPKPDTSDQSTCERSEQRQDSDSICYELAQLLVSSAIMRARHELEHEEESFSNLNDAHMNINTSDKSIGFFSPIANESGSESLALTANQSSIVTMNSTSASVSLSASYHSSPFLQLESTQDSQNISGVLRKRRHQRGLLADTGGDESRQSLSPVLDDPLANKDIVETFAANMHRIDKDVLRCDRNYPYFMLKENLDKLKNVIYTLD